MPLICVALLDTKWYLILWLALLPCNFTPELLSSIDTNEKQTFFKLILAKLFKIVSIKLVGHRLANRRFLETS